MKQMNLSQEEQWIRMKVNKYTYFKKVILKIWVTLFCYAQNKV